MYMLIAWLKSKKREKTVIQTGNVVFVLRMSLGWMWVWGQWLYGQSLSWTAVTALFFCQMAMQRLILTCLL